MFEARLIQGNLLKKLIDSIKELVTESNFDVSPQGISLQAMDSSHVALVSLMMKQEMFEHYRADRTISLGMNLASLTKVLKCSGNDDVVTLKAEDTADTVTVMFESKNEDRISDFEMKLMDIDSEHLGIPDTDYNAQVKMPSAEFQRICRDLSTLGDTVTIAASKDGLKFTVAGDIGTGNITVRPSGAADKEEEAVTITIEEPVTLTFALRYLNFFTKATPLSPTVTLQLSPNVPLVTMYELPEDHGYVRFYLAPKIDDEA